MNRIITTCALLFAGIVVLVISTQVGFAVADSGGDVRNLPAPSVLWLVSGGLFCLAAMGRRSNR